MHNAVANHILKYLLPVINHLNSRQAVFIALPVSGQLIYGIGIPTMKERKLVEPSNSQSAYPSYLVDCWLGELLVVTSRNLRCQLGTDVRMCWHPPNQKKPKSCSAKPSKFCKLMCELSVITEPFWPPVDNQNPLDCGDSARKMRRGSAPAVCWTKTPIRSIVFSSFAHAEIRAVRVDERKRTYARFRIHHEPFR